MMLPNISEFIKRYVTKREKSFFENDLINNKEKLTIKKVYRTSEEFDIKAIAERLAEAYNDELITEEQAKKSFVKALRMFELKKRMNELRESDPYLKLDIFLDSLDSRILLDLIKSLNV